MRGNTDIVQLLCEQKCACHTAFLLPAQFHNSVAVWHMRVIPVFYLTEELLSRQFDNNIHFLLIVLGENIVDHQNRIADCRVRNHNLRLALERSLAANVHRLCQINQIRHLKRRNIAFNRGDRCILQLLCRCRHIKNLCRIDAQIQKKLLHQKRTSDIEQCQHIPLDYLINDVLPQHPLGVDVIL